MLITLRGARVYYEQHGEGKPDVLLLHGWGCDTALWKPVTEYLSKLTRVTVIDFPGHGQSGRPPEPWGAEEYAEMVAQLIEALGIQGCDVIGHSHGGRIAILLAAQRPELVRKVVLAGASGLHTEPTEEQKKRSDAYKRLRGLSDALESVKIFGSAPEKMREALRKKYGSRDYNALDAEMRKTFVKVVNFDALPYLSQIKAPTLLVWGTQDTETPLWMGQKMEKLIPDAGLIVWEGASHYAYLERSADFNRIVQQFFIGGVA